MKENKFIKTTIIALFLAFTLTSCLEDGEVQFIVVDDFETNVSVSGLATSTTFSVDNNTDISGLLDNATTFIEADVEKVTITLQDDYAGDALTGDFKLALGTLFGTIVIDQELTLAKGVGVEVEILDGASNILSLIEGGSFPFKFDGTFTSPTGDDNFTINLVFKVKATLE